MTVFHRLSWHPIVVGYSLRENEAEALNKRAESPYCTCTGSVVYSSAVLYNTGAGTVQVCATGNPPSPRSSLLPLKPNFHDSNIRKEERSGGLKNK